jgi:general stress protein 26
MKHDLTKVLAVLERAQLMTIATVADTGHPQSAVVSFASTPAAEIIFGTNKTSRKHANLQRDPHAALVIGWDDFVTVQYEGKAVPLEGQELADCQKIFADKLPWGQRMVEDANIAFFKVTPEWLRYTDINQRPWEVREVKP